MSDASVIGVSDALADDDSAMCLSTAALLLVVSARIYDLINNSTCCGCRQIRFTNPEVPCVNVATQSSSPRNTVGSIVVDCERCIVCQ